MTQATNTWDKYDVGTGNREDLSDMISNVSPFDTPILSAMGKTKATSTKHEWLNETLAAAKMNHAIEGDDGQDADILTGRTRIFNYTPILKKKMVVSGTQESGMDPAGIQSEMAHQEAKKMKEIKLDLEYMCINGGVTDGIGNIQVAGNATTAREMSSLQCYIATNADVAALGSASTGDGTDAMTSATDRALTEAMLTTVLGLCFDNGAEPTLLAVDSTNKGLVSGFAGGSTRYVDTNTKELIHSIDVYVGDFHTLKVCPSRNTPAEIAYVLDPQYLKLAELRPLQSYDLAKNGDNIKREMVWECCLQVGTEKAHGIIGDLGG
jgi:hypothetical protein